MNRAGGGVTALLDDYRAYAGARLWLALVLMLLGAFAEGVGILILVPLAAVAVGGGASPWVAGVAGWLPHDRRFPAILLMFVAAMAARSLLLYVRDRELARLQSGYEASLRLRSAATLARRGWAFASGIGQAGMQSLLLTDVPRAALAVAEAQLFATAAAMLAVQLLVAAVLSPALAAIAFAILLTGLPLSIRWTRRSVDSGIALTERAEESAGSGFRLHAGLKAALAQGTVPQFLIEYRSSLARQQADSVRFAGDLASARQLASFGAAVAAAALLFAGVELLHLPFAVLLPVLVLFARMVPAAQTLQHSAQYVSAWASAFQAIERRLEGLESADVRARAAAPLDWRVLRIDQASYVHPTGLGVRGINLTLNRGEWLGLKGASGAGKTTLVDLVAGLIDAASGDISVDGEALNGAVREQWRSGLAYLGQDGLVFDDSVRGNLLADGAEADEATLWQALASAGLDERIRAFAGGLDERIGDRGSQLSGGERQRLAIARALLRKPTLLILDEATAALDVEAEAGLLKGLRALDSRPAAIVVAHREATLGYCDSIVAIPHGAEENQVIRAI